MCSGIPLPPGICQQTRMIYEDWQLSWGYSNLNTVMIYTTPTSAELTSRMEKAELTNPYTQDTSTFIPEN
jgi:hypothetical protein